MAASTESLNYVQKMFIAFLGRAGAPAGMEYYAALIDADEASGKAILFDDLFYSDQGQELFGDATTIETVKIIFNNVMGRDPEDAGLIYWVNAITNGDFNVAEAAAVIADSAANDADDLAALEAKTTAADAVTAHLTANPDDIAGYQAGFAEARTSLGDVTAANVDAFDAASEVAGVINGIGFGGARTLTTGNDTVTGTDDQEVVTGIIGTGATFGQNDSITDTTSGDTDTLNLSGNANYDHTGVGGNGVSGFEIVNLDLAKQSGSAFTVTNLTNDVEQLNVEVSSTVDVVGITVAGETSLTVAGDVGGTVGTTNVTDVVVTNTGDNAFGVSGDSALTSVTATGANDAGVSVTLANDATTVLIGGADGANDAGTVSASGAVALTVNQGGNNIDDLTLSGNGAAVTYTLTGADAGTEYTVTGDQDVTLVGNTAAFTANPLTDSSTGSVSVNITTGAAPDLEQMGVLSGGLEISGALATGTATLQTGNTVTFSADQTGALTFDSNDTAAGGTISVVLENDTDDLTFSGYETVSINTGTIAAEMGNMTTGANDVLNLAGSGSLDATANGDGDITAGATTMSLSGALTLNDVTTSGADGSSMTLSGDSVTVNALDSSASNDAITVTSTANDVTIASTVNSGTGSVTITSAGDVSTGAVTAGAVSISGGDVTAGDISGTTVSLTSTNDSAASTFEEIVATGGATFTGGTWTQADANDINANGGTLTISGSTVTIASGNDVRADSIVITGAGDVDLGDQVNTSVVNASAATGNVTMAIDANDGAEGVTVQTGSGADSVTTNQAATIFNLTLGAGADTLTVTDTDAITADTGAGDDTVTLTALSGATSTINTGADDDTVNVSTTATSSVVTVATGDGDDTVTVDANSIGAGLTLTTGDGDDTITINDTGNDVNTNAGGGDDTITLADDAAGIVNAGAGDDTINLGNDADGTIDGGAGTDTLVLKGNDISDDDVSFSNIEKVDISGAANDAVMSAAQLAGDNTFELVGTGNLTNSVLTINATTGNDTTIDASSVSSQINTAGSININGGAGNDTITHNGYSGTVSGGAGADTINGGAGQDTITGGDGADTIDGGADIDTITGGNDADTLTGGAGADTFVFDLGNEAAGGANDHANDAYDTITDFVSGTDSIQVTGVGNSNEVIISGSALTNEASVIAAVDAQLSGSDNDIVIVTDVMDSGDTWIYIDVDGSNDITSSDHVIVLTGIDNGEIAAGDVGP